jgi:hypothetical protein
MSISLDQCIAFLAEHGASKLSVAKALGIRYESFLDMCKAMPDVVWPERGHSNGAARQHKQQRGKCSEMKRGAVLKAAKASADARKTKVAFGRTGTIAQHVEWFGVVCYAVVRRRLKDGMTLEQALTYPSQRGRGRSKEGVGK